MLVYDKVRHGLGLHRRFYQIHKMGVKVDLHLLLFKVYQTLVKRNKTIKRLLGLCGCLVLLTAHAPQIRYKVNKKNAN